LVATTTGVVRPGLRQRLGDQPLVVADVRLVEAVHVRRVDQRDPGPQRRVQDLDRLGLRRSTGDRQRHPAEPDLGHMEAGAAELSSLHTRCLE
jgi:hypothetical protein